MFVNRIQNIAKENKKKKNKLNLMKEMLEHG